MTTLIGLILAGVAVGMVLEAIDSLQTPAESSPGWLAFAIATASIFIKEALYRFTIKNGRRINSAALIANAWHQRSDMMSSVPAALAVLGTELIMSER